MKHHVTALILATAMVPAAAAQHNHGEQATSPYTELTARSIKALSDQEIADLQQGNGMGFALPAELNGYPGPKHVLELATELGLSDEQVSRTTAVFDRMQEAAKKIGAELVATEATLDQAFASRSIEEGQLHDLTRRAGELRSALRATHLQAHLVMLSVLTDEQVHSYNMARGYHSGH